MRPRFVNVCLVLSLLVVASPLAAAWIGLDGASPATPDFTVTGSTSALTVDLDIPGYDISTVEIDGETYSVVSMPGAVPRLERGLPELPVLARSLMIPHRGLSSLKIVETRWEEFAAAPIAPSKGSITRNVNPDDVSYAFGSFYDEGGVWPSTNFELSDPFIVRDVRGVSLHISPFQYDADRGVLRVLRSARIEVGTAGSGVNEKTTSVRAVDPQFARIYDGLFLNYGAEKYTPIDEPGRMLIISNDAYMSLAQPFYDWKLQKGIDVEMISISSVGGSAAGVLSAITTRYNEPEGLTYVVLVGDTGQIPTNSGTFEGASTDTRYVMIDGSDLYPDLFISRISGNTATEIQVQVNKFIRYERDPDTGAAAEWYHKASGLASNEGSPTDAERMDDVRDVLLGYDYTVIDQIYQPTGGTADIAAAVNEGRSLINYLGHGSGTSWSNPYFSNTDVNALNNGWSQPWIVDIACLNGAFANTTCFAEAWLRAGSASAPEGAVGMYSSSTNASWVPPTFMQSHIADLLVAESENTLGALYYFGSMNVIDLYPGTNGEGHRLIEQYNIFGDCSLVVRTDVPDAIAAVHQPAVFLNSASYDVDVAGEAGLTVSLTADGVIYGTAVTDASGHATVMFDTPVTVPGDVTITVTGFNMVPYILDVPAINPSTVVIDPTSIDAGVATDVTVTVYGSDGVTPLQDVMVWARQFSYFVTPVATDVNGQAVLSITAPYGPQVEIVGQAAGDTFELFSEMLTVNALPLTVPDLWVTTGFGMSDQFGLNLTGTLNASVGESPATLIAEMPQLEIISTTAADLAVVPTTLGQVVAHIAVEGYDLYTEAFDVVEAYGTVSGNLTGDGSALAGAEVVFSQGGEVAFSATTDGSGDYAVTEAQLVDTYTLNVDVFGYLPHEETYFLGYGANVHDIVLSAAPSGELTGVVTELGTGAPLDATLRFVLPADGSTYLEVSTDPADGSYSATLPYFTYDVVVTSSGHIPHNGSIDVDAATLTQDFALDVTSGNILIVDDGGAKRSVPAKYVGKDRIFSAPGYEAEADRSALVIQADLEALGYTVTVETLSGTDAATWASYDLLVVSSGANQTTLNNATFRTNLSNWCVGGGKLLLEGGEIGYDYRSDTTMQNNVMHFTAWNGDSSGSVTVNDASHPVMSTPNTVTGPIDVAYSGYGDEDRLTVAADAEYPGNWSSYATNTSVIAYDADEDPSGGHMVFFTFCYESMASPARTGLLHNAVAWLLAADVGSASVSGHVYETGSGSLIPLADVTVELEPIGLFATTDANGRYEITDLFGGDYTVRVSKTGWSQNSAPISLADGEALSAPDLWIFRYTDMTECVAPAMAIPDDDSTGVVVSVPMYGSQINTVSGVEVYLDISHEYMGDLVIEMESPSGTVVPLHVNAWGDATTLVGWCPSEMAIAGDMNDFRGDATAGYWLLHVKDTSAMAVGTINEVCVKLVYAVQTTGVGDEAPKALSLADNVPNPFNPATMIRFSTPVAGPVELTIYDVAGRKVRSLVSGQLSADTHEVTWYGRDDLGRAVGSGVYYYKLSTKSGSTTKKMTLLK